ncbi:glycosyltransferase family 4 protein [Thiotrichales bacterium 19S11-10]|nr:glycosyltransferase family 4 protein [Thiotrichales bacterium 19S11-10]
MYKAAVFASLPPPVGGIASITSMLKDCFSEEGTVLFREPVEKHVKSQKFRSLISIRRLIQTVKQTDRNSNVLVFSSAGLSFYEKTLWAFIIYLFGRNAYILLVDGNFPQFWSKKGSIIKYILSWILYRSKCTLCCQSSRWVSYYSNEFRKNRVIKFPATVRKEFQSRVQKHLNIDDFRSRKIQLLYVGWIIKEKGIEQLLKAINEINSDNIVLNIVGPSFDDDSAKLLEKIIKTKFVKYHGCITDLVELKKIFEKVDLFVFPSWAEGLPVSLIEAISQGLPCIATDVGGIPDVIKHQVNGLIIPPKDTTSLVNALTQLIEDQACLLSMSEQSCNIFDSQFSLYLFRKNFAEILGVS